jgi:hypothetical protein
MSRRKRNDDFRSVSLKGLLCEPTVSGELKRAALYSCSANSDEIDEARPS